MNSQRKCPLLIGAVVVAVSTVFITHTGSAQVSAGAGTSGRIPVWTGAHSQGNSVITQSGSNIGIGTTAPTAPLTVNSTTATPAILAKDTSNGPAVWGVGNTGFGLRGNSTSYIGVGGFSTNFVGVAGNGPSIGVWGASNAGNGVYATSASSNGVYGLSTDGYGVHGKSTNSYGAYFESANNDAADFYGNDWGIYVTNSGNRPAVHSAALGSNSYGGEFTSGSYRAGYFKAFSNGLYSLYVDTADGPTQPTSGLEVNGSIKAEGNLYVAGSKAGYVVDEMQNADHVDLEAGDVVVVAEDSSAPVLGKIPVPRIKLATSANDSAVVGIVDEAMYVPDATTRAAYEAQQTADREAASRAQRDPESKLDGMANIQNRISDAAGTLHSDPTTTSAKPNAYCSVVTLGAYKAVKVDASFGAIRPGDLLTTSTHAGYAMKVSDKAAASGAIVGKALSSLPSGVGTVSVLVTLK